MTQASLAAMIGKDKSVVVRYEAGNIDIPSSMLLSIAEALQVPLNDLVKEESEK